MKFLQKIFNLFVNIINLLKFLFLKYYKNFFILSYVFIFKNILLNYVAKVEKLILKIFYENVFWFLIINFWYEKKYKIFLKILVLFNGRCLDLKKITIFIIKKYIYYFYLVLDEVKK